MIRLLRASDRIAAPWKNGGGVTREVAVHPPGAAMDDFAWRISLAEVAADGPFSAFPGIDRILTVIEGGGMCLDLAGTVVRLDASAPSLAFAGETPVTATLVEGPIRDLNLMVRRGRWRGAVRRQAVDGACAMASKADVLMVLALDTIDIVQGARVWRLGPQDAAVIDRDDAASTAISLSGQGRILIVEIQQLSSASL